MSESLARVAVAVAGFALAAHALAQAQAGSAQRGERLYVANLCYTCHGYAGQGGERGSGPRIAPDVWPLPAFAQQVRRPRQDMPRYSPKFLTDAEIADIHAYLTSIRPGPKGTDVMLLRD